MDLKNFYSITKPIYFILIALVISSCGTYQYSGNVNDGIYNSNISSENAIVVETKEVNNKANNDYYKSAFSEKALIYSESESSDQLFTDVENYRTSDNDSIRENYGPWGDYKDSVVINIHSFHNDGFWSRWRYPNWMWNYGYGYGNVWGYGYNNFWSRPYPYYGGFYDPFNPFWGYYDSFYYGYGYGYGYPYGYYSWWRPYNSWYNYSPYGRNLNTNISFVSGRRGSRNALSSRSNNISNSNIRDRFNRTSSNTLSDRLSRIDRINSSARVNPNMYNKPFNSAGSSNSLSKPRTYGGDYNNSRPSGNYSKPSNNYSRPSNNNYKPSGSSNYSSPSYSRPSSGYSPSSSSSFSRGGGGMSSGSSSSRGGKSGR
jgi:hypothetical protein